MTTEQEGHPERGLARFQEWWNRHEKVRFLVVGAYNTVFGYAVFAGLYMLLHARIHYLVVLTVSHFVAVSNAFIGHKFMTFRAKGHFLSDFLRFNLTYLGTLFFGLVALPFLVEACRVPVLLSQAILITITMMGSYILHKHISFSRK